MNPQLKNEKPEPSQIYEEALRDFLTQRIIWDTLTKTIPCLGIWFILGVSMGEWPNALGAIAGYIAIALLGTANAITRGRFEAHYQNGDLCDWQIHYLCKDSKVIKPYHPNLVEPNSYDLKLSNRFSRINPDGTIEKFESDEIQIEPGESLLAHTQETLNLPNDVKGMLQGKSSWARLSMFVESAGLFDSGFEGTAVLELFNSGKHAICLKNGDRIAQISFHRTPKVAIPYGSETRNNHYQGQKGAANSWLSKADRIKPR